MDSIRPGRIREESTPGEQQTPTDKLKEAEAEAEANTFENCWQTDRLVSRRYDKYDKIKKTQYYIWLTITEVNSKTAMKFSHE